MASTRRADAHGDSVVRVRFRGHRDKPTDCLLITYRPELTGAVGPASPSLIQFVLVGTGMAAENDETSPKYEIPDTDTYRDKTQDVTDVRLPSMGFVIPAYETPPGRLMNLLEEYNLAAVFGGDGSPDDLVGDDGEIVVNRLMRNEVVPNIVTERTNKDAIHWGDSDVADDPTQDDLDLTELSDEDLAALMEGIVMGDMDELPEDKIEKFPG